MSIAFRALFVGDRSETYSLFERWLKGTDIAIDDVVGHADVLAAVARRTPDLIVLGFTTPSTI